MTALADPPEEGAAPQMVSMTAEQFERSVEAAVALDRLYRARAHGDKIPGGTKEAIDNWVAKGWRPGGFVTAVLCNDLAGAFARADCFNVQALQAIITYVSQECPPGSWGSPEQLEIWATRFERSEPPC